QRGNYGEAVEHASKAIALDSRCAQAHYARALAYYRQTDASHCLEDISRFIDLRPLSGSRNAEEPYMIRGVVLLWLKRPQDALRNFVMARRLNPSSLSATWGLWEAYTQMRKYLLACQLAEQMVRLDPGNSYALVSCAESYAAIGRF